MDYTKGIWELVETKSECFGETITSRKICHESPYGLVELNINSVGNKYPEAEANAYLIAAAPQLYEACKLAIGGRNNWGEAIRKALAKAEGKS